MYAFITGKVAYVEEMYVVIENNGIGYRIFACTDTLQRLSNASGDVCLYTYLSIKDDGMTLYGFYTKQEKSLFLQLIGVSGVGCKTALLILSSASVPVLSNTIAMGNVAGLSKVKGLGKKTAERIILELRGKLDLELKFISEDNDGGMLAVDRISADALSALVSLGISDFEAQKYVREFRSRVTSAEELIALILRGIDR